jgi:hypothetical protein
MTTTNREVFVRQYERLRFGNKELVRQHFRSYPSS